MRNLMTTDTKLDLLIIDYFKEPDKKRIQNIALNIPGYKGYFWVIEANRLKFDRSTLTFEQVDPFFSLAIYFSFSDKTKKGKSLLCKITESKCFNDFNLRKESGILIYYKGGFFNSRDIIEEIKCIMTSIFENVDFAKIDATITRLDNWMTIQ